MICNPNNPTGYLKTPADKIGETIMMVPAAGFKCYQTEPSLVVSEDRLFCLLELDYYDIFADADDMITTASVCVLL